MSVERKLAVTKTRLPILICLFSLAAPLTAMAQGILLPCSGAVNRGMGGATTGAAIEAIGSMYWNPATISNLPWIGSSSSANRLPSSGDSPTIAADNREM